MGMLVRVMIFTVVGLLGIGVSLVFVTSVFTPLPNIFIGLSTYASPTTHDYQAHLLQCPSPPS
jgi:hypothetical protein